MRAAAGSAPAVDWATGKPVRETLDTQDGDAPPPDLSITVSQADPEYGSISVYLDSCKALSVLPSKVAVEQFGSRDFKLPMFGLGVGAAEAIGAALAINKTVTTIDLSQNGLGNFGLVAIAKALEANENIRKANLSRVAAGWGSAGAELVPQHLGNVLRGCLQLQSLNLSGNALGDNGAKEVLDAAIDAAQEELLCLDIGSTKAGNLAAHSIAALLVEGTGLRQVGLASLQVPTHLWLGKVLPALSVAGRLVSADLSGNYVTDEVCVELAKQLPQMETLKVLDITGWDLAGRSLQVVGAALSRRRLPLQMLITDVPSGKGLQALLLRNPRLLAMKEVPVYSGEKRGIEAAVAEAARAEEGKAESVKANTLLDALKHSAAARLQAAAEKERKEGGGEKRKGSRDWGWSLFAGKAAPWDGRAETSLRRRVAKEGAAALDGLGRPLPPFDPTARNFDGHLDVELFFDDYDDEEENTAPGPSAPGPVMRRLSQGWQAVRRTAEELAAAPEGMSLINRPKGTFNAHDPAWGRQLRLELRGLVAAARDMLTPADMEAGWWLWKGMELQPMVAEVAKVKELLKTDGLDHALQERLGELLAAVRGYCSLADRVLSDLAAKETDPRVLEGFRAASEALNGARK